MPNNKHKRRIRERMARTGEPYSTARRNYLAERGLPEDTTTSATTLRNKEKAIREEYGEHLGVDEQGRPTTPVVQQKRGGRVTGP